MAYIDEHIHIFYTTRILAKKEAKMKTHKESQCTFFRKKRSKKQELICLVISPKAIIYFFSISLKKNYYLYK